MNCSIAQALEMVGEWWTFLILREALLGVRRFDDFQAHLGISRNVLTQRLESLVDDGILKRVQYENRPPRYEYRLTDKGRALWPVLNALREWGDEWILGLEKAPVVLVHDRCGHECHASQRCSHCGDELQPREMHFEPGPGAPADPPSTTRPSRTKDKIPT